MRTEKEKKLRRRYARALLRHVNAQVGLSWKGGRDPEEWDEIEVEAKRAAQRLRLVIDELFREAFHWL